LQVRILRGERKNDGVRGLFDFRNPSSSMRRGKNEEEKKKDAEETQKNQSIFYLQTTTQQRTGAGAVWRGGGDGMHT